MTASEFIGPALVADKLIDLGVGVAATLVGIVVVFVAARPRIDFAAAVYGKLNPNGTVRYGIRIRPRGRILSLTELKVTAHILIGSPGRTTSVPVPLSRETWTKVRRSGDSEHWTATPQLFLREVQWGRYLTKSSPPIHPFRLEALLSERPARLVIVVTAVSSVFGVTTVSEHRYSAHDVELDPTIPEGASETTPSRVLSRLLSTLRRILSGRPRAEG